MTNVKKSASGPNSSFTGDESRNVMNEILEEELELLRKEGAHGEAENLKKYAKTGDVNIKINYMTVEHGLKPKTKFESKSKITFVYYMAKKNEIIVFDAKQRAHILNHKHEFVRTKIPMNCYVDKCFWTEAVSLFVAYEKRSKQLVCYSEKFKLHGKHDTVEAIVDAQPCDETSKIYVAEMTAISVWTYAGDQISIECAMRVTRIPPMASVNGCFQLHVEHTSSRTQRAYLVAEKWILSIIINLNFTQQFLYDAQFGEVITCSIRLPKPMWLACGYKRGTVRIFDRELKPKFTLVGIDEDIVALSTYPEDESLIAAMTTERKLIVWDIVQERVLERKQFSFNVTSLLVMNKCLYLLTNTMLVCQSINSVYRKICNINTLTKKVHSCGRVGKSKYRVASIGSDNVVRICDAKSGTIITSALFSCQVRDVAFSPTSDEMFVALENGMVVKCITAMNPVFIESKWEMSVVLQSNGNYLQNASESEIKLDVSKLCILRGWVDKHTERLAFKDTMEAFNFDQEITKDSEGNETAPNQRKKYFLIAGTDNGYLAVIDHRKGKPLNVIRAHESKLIAISSDSTCSKIVTSGADFFVRIWSFSHITNTLDLSDSLKSPLLAPLLAIASNLLMVHYFQPNGSTQSLVMFDFDTNERFDHKPEFDHKKALNDLQVNKVLLLFISCSDDGTIRIWNEQNVLTRIISVHGSAGSICFIGNTPDVVFHRLNHLFLIKYKTLLPKRNWGRTVFLDSLENDAKAENAIPYTQKVVNLMNEFDKARFFRRNTFDGEIPVFNEGIPNLDNFSEVSKKDYASHMGKVKKCRDIIARVVNYDNIYEQLPPALELSDGAEMWLAEDQEYRKNRMLYYKNIMLEYLQKEELYPPKKIFSELEPHTPLTEQQKHAFLEPDPRFDDVWGNEKGFFPSKPKNYDTPRVIQKSKLVMVPNSSIIKKIWLLVDIHAIVRMRQLARERKPLRVNTKLLEQLLNKKRRNSIFSDDSKLFLNSDLNITQSSNESMSVLRSYSEGDVANAIVNVPTEPIEEEPVYIEEEVSALPELETEIAEVYDQDENDSEQENGVATRKKKKKKLFGKKKKSK